MADNTENKQQNVKPQEPVAPVAPVQAPITPSRRAKKTWAEKRAEKKHRKMVRRSRFRFFKNFCWWAFGCFSGVILFFASIILGVLFIPVNTITGGKNEGVVSEELASSTIGDIVLNLNKYGFDDLPILVEAVKGIAEGDASQYVEIDYDKLESIRFGSSNIGEEIKGCIKIVATIEGTVGTETLGDVGTLSVFSEWEEVEGTVDTSAETFNPKLYYYKPSNAPYAANTKEYVRAFADDGTMIAPAGSTLYYAALAKVPVLDALDIIDESLSRLGLTELLEKLGGADFDADSLVSNVLGDNTIGSIGDITLDNILLKDVLGEDDTTEIAKILVSVTGTPYAEISLGSLAGEDDLVFENIAISTFIAKEDAGMLGDLLESLVPDTPYEDITIGDFTGEEGINFDGVALSKLLGEDIGEDAKNILEMVTGEDFANITIGTLLDLEIQADQLKLDEVLTTMGATLDADTKKLIEAIIPGDKAFADVTVSDLTSISFDNVILKDVLGDGVSQDTIDLIEKLVPGDKSYEQITVSDLTNIDLEFSEMLLVDVVGDSMNADTKKLLSTVLGGVEFDDITIGHLTSTQLDFTDVLLSDVVGDDMNAETKNLLEKVLGKSYNSIKVGDFSKGLDFGSVLVSDVLGEEVTQNTKDLLTEVVGKSYNSITVSDLTEIEFTIEDVKISDYLDAESDIAHILEDATGIAFSEISFGDLTGATFHIENVHLKSVLDSSNIGDLKAIFDDIYHADQEGGTKFEDLTIADLSELDFDNVHIETILPLANDHPLRTILEDEFNKPFEEVVLSDLNSFNVGMLHLNKVLPVDKVDINLIKIICQVAGKTGCTTDAEYKTAYESLAITDLYAREGVNVMDNVKLSALLSVEDVDSPILKQLITKGVSVNGLATAIDDLKIHEVYGATVFKQVDGSMPVGALRFSKSGNTYTQNDAGEYYLSKDAGIWLLIGYTAQDVNLVTGRPTSYVANDAMTLSALQSSGSVVGTIFENATIRQLVDAGLISSVNEALYPLKLSQVLNPVA